MERQHHSNHPNRQDQEFDSMINRISGVTGGMNKFMEALWTPKQTQIVFMVEKSEIIDGEIKVLYYQEDDPDDLECASDRIPIPDFCAWLKKNRYNVISVMAHVSDVYSMKTKEYEPEDLINDPLFERDYYLELYLMERGY